MPAKIVNGSIIPTYNQKHLKGNIYSLMASVSEYELLTVTAGLTGDYNTALQALASHPLIPTVKFAKILLDRILTQYKLDLEQFAR
jgi:6-phospho-beta-glucosidase